MSALIISRKKYYNIGKFKNFCLTVKDSIAFLTKTFTKSSPLFVGPLMTVGNLMPRVCERSRGVIEEIKKNVRIWANTSALLCQLSTAVEPYIFIIMMILVAFHQWLDLILLFLSQIRCNSHDPEDVLPACQTTLKNLQLSYLDLYLVSLIHVYPFVRRPKRNHNKKFI